MRPHGAKRGGVGHVVGDQRHGLARSGGLRGGLQHSGGETAIMGAQAGQGGNRAGGDAPIACRRVMHRIMKSVGDNSRCGKASALRISWIVSPSPPEEAKTVGCVAGSRSAAAKASAPAARATSRFSAPGGAHWPAAAARRAGPLALADNPPGPPSISPGLRPALDPGAVQPDTFDIDAHHAARPSTRLQFTPPKPKALLKTRSMRAARPGEHVAAAKAWVEAVRMRAAGQKPVLDGKRAQHRPDHAGSPQRVPGKPLARTARHIAAEQSGHGAILRRVARQGRGAMQVDIVDIRGVQPGLRQRLAPSRAWRPCLPDAARTYGRRPNSRPCPAAALYRCRAPLRAAPAARNPPPRRWRCRCARRQTAGTAPAPSRPARGNRTRWWRRAYRRRRQWRHRTARRRSSARRWQKPSRSRRRPWTRRRPGP